MDTQGFPIDGYFDVPEYSNPQILAHDEYSSGSLPGYYYDKSGKQVFGDIVLKDNKAVCYVNGDGFDKETLKANEVFSFVVGVDSFFSAYNFSVEDRFYSERKPRFIKHYCSSDDYDFAMHYRTYTNGTMVTYLIRERGTDFWVSPPGSYRNEVKQYLSEYFGHIPGAQEQIDARELGVNDIPKLMLVSVLYDKYLNGESFYLDEWWNIRIGKKEGSIEGRILNVDSIWTISYYKDGIKIYDSQTKQINPKGKEGFMAQFFSSAPLENHSQSESTDANWLEGQTMWYYPSGQLRKKTQFVDNRPTHVLIFHPNGRLHYEYKVAHKKDETKMRMSGGIFTLFTQKIDHIEYLQVASPDGTPVLDENGSGNEVISDEMNDRKVYRTYENRKLTESYFYQEEQKIHQWSDELYEVAPIGKKWDKEKQYMSFKRSTERNIIGAMPVVLTIDPVGKNQSAKIYGSLGAELDSLVSDFFKLHEDLGNFSSINFDSFKKENKKVSYEVVLPFVFRTLRFTNEPGNNNWYLHPSMFNTPAMNFTPPPMPSIPRY